MLYAGLDLSRQRLDVHVLDEDGRTVEVTAVRPDADALRSLVTAVARHGQPVTATIESMNGARFVHDTLELATLLEVPEGTVKSRLFTARHILAEHLRWLVTDSRTR